MTERLVVIGGGAAGMSAASAARRTDPVRDVVVLEAGGYAAYGACGIPYYVGGHVDRAESLLAYPPSFFRDQRGIDLRLHTRVSLIDAERRMVCYRNGPRESRLSYRHLVVAAGGTPIRPPIPGLDDPYAFTVRTLEDAIRLRSLLDAGHVGRALVVGTGYLGLEMTEALTARGVQVTVAEQLPRVMPNLDPEPAALVEDEVRRHGVDLRLGARIDSVRRTANGLEASVDSAIVRVDAVVVATGVRAESNLAAAAGALTGPGGALLVDDRMRTSLPDVFAAGDCIAPYHRVLGRPAFVPLGPAANKTGRVAGTVAAGGDARFAGILGTAVVKVFDLAVASTGLTLTDAAAEGIAAVATDVMGRSRAKYLPGSAPVWARLVHENGGRLLGAQLIGPGDGVAKRIDAVAVGLQAGLDVEDLKDLDLCYAPPYAPVYEPLLLAAQAATAVGAPRHAMKVL
ncbi:FAD-dependent oxidoreductase [Mycobacterium sp. SM1]|uniref:FAD-dependent oxidoreductase n=1 Tax=Mycobacterium sp. SM1 TaxID=2816243 RepID=UPI001BD0CCC9|nr:FAD-dependent oxidoreductase [Mycobacterium sp. SM1]MBS4728728.1 FAD-dependent oxidoreductase [Mycobacterium sp. SM1]